MEWCWQSVFAAEGRWLVQSCSVSIWQWLTFLAVSASTLCQSCHLLATYGWEVMPPVCIMA